MAKIEVTEPETMGDITSQVKEVRVKVATSKSGYRYTQLLITYKMGYTQSVFLDGAEAYLLTALAEETNEQERAS